jgi:hypothetical protein
MSVHSGDYELMLTAYRDAEGDPSVFSDTSVAHLVVHQNRVIGSHLVPGLEAEAEGMPDGINLTFRVQPGAKIERPVHLCFGILPEEGRQEINIEGRVGEGAEVNLLAHCIFPNAVKIVHQMKAHIRVGRDAAYDYHEVHFHGETGGTQIIPHAKIELEQGARLTTTFQLTRGRVGNLDIEYDVEAAAMATAQMEALVLGYGDDRIRIREKCRLNGEHSRGLIKSRVAVKEEATSEVISEMVADARHARGHVDCVEIVRDKASARAVPIVDVYHCTAKVTHEAAIGSVNKKELETLMARGLSREEAVDVIIRGMLRPI